MKRSFRRSGDRIEVHLVPTDRALLGQVLAVLESVGATIDDPAVAVLQRDAYADDADASAKFASITEGEVASLRGIDRDVLGFVADGAEDLSRPEALSLLRSINEARLALGARAGAFDMGDAWSRQIDHDQRLVVVAWLGALQADLLRVVPSTR